MSDGNSDKKPIFKKVLNAAEKAFKKLHELGTYQPEDLAKVKEYQALIKETTNVFKLGISQEVPEEMKAYLEKDVFVFSGLKTHAQLAEARSLLKDSDGNIRPYHLFEQDVLKLNEKYNQNYLEAEWQFAQSSSQSAANWANLSDSERYNLQYRTAGDEKVRQSHAALNGTTLPKSSEFWISYYPPNGWRCRCIAVLVLASKYPATDVDKATAAAEKATTQIGKNGKNKLEMFRFNPGIEKRVFPKGNSYEKVFGAEEAKKFIEKPEINLDELIKGEIPTNTEVKNILMKFAEKFPENFRNGLEDVKFTTAETYMMQHSMKYNPRTGEWVGGSTISFSNHTFNGFTPLKELKNALGAIKAKKELTFNQEYSLESLWHEILHAKTKTKPVKLDKIQSKNMETINEFIARHTYDDFIEKLGGKASNKKEVLDNGYGYSSWITEFRKRLKDNEISEEKAVEFFTPHLMENYSTIGLKIREFFTQK